jgi:hypothetical protein
LSGRGRFIEFGRHVDRICATVYPVQPFGSISGPLIETADVIVYDQVK